MSIDEEALAVRGGGGGAAGTTKPEPERFDHCFSGLQISIPIEAGGLKNIDGDKLKAEIKRWAKAVVAYARQVSDRFGSRN
ncbi:hypothetical protein AAC387_Pa05g2269 [Persea americana]